MTVEEARIAAVANRKKMNDGENPNVTKRQYKQDRIYLFYQSVLSIIVLII